MENERNLIENERNLFENERILIENESNCKHAIASLFALMNQLTYPFDYMKSALNVVKSTKFFVVAKLKKCAK